MRAACQLREVPVLGASKVVTAIHFAHGTVVGTGVGVDGDGLVEFVGANGDEEMVAVAEAGEEDQWDVVVEFVAEVGDVAAIGARPEAETASMVGEIGGDDAADAGIVDGGGYVVLAEVAAVVVGDHGERGGAAGLRFLRDEGNAEVGGLMRGGAGDEEEWKKFEIGDWRFQISQPGR